MRAYVKCGTCINEAAVKEQWGWPVSEDDFWVRATHKYMNQNPMCEKHYNQVVETVRTIVASCKPCK